MKQNVKFVFADVICKLWNFMVRLDPTIGERANGALSVMHAKGPNLECQVILFLIKKKKNLNSTF